MNKKLYLILFSISALFLAALLSRSRDIALLTIPFLVYLGIGAIAAPRDIHLSVARELSILRTVEDVPVTVTLTVENSGGRIPRLQIMEPVFEKMNLVEGNLTPSYTILSDERIKVVYTFTAAHGFYNWQTVKMKVSDPFGLFEQTVEMDAPGHVHVFPRQIDLRNFSFRPVPNVRTTGPNPSRLPGSGVDFWGVREYHPGDALRTIYWRKSAQHPGTLITKEFEREEIADVGILLDARSSANDTANGEDLFENSIRAAASLASHFISKGNRVSMLILNDRLVRVFPGYGKHQLLRILEELSCCTPGERVSFDTLKYLPVRLFPNHSLITIISPLLPNDFPFLARLKAEGYQLLLASPERPNPVIKNNAYAAYAQRIAAVERAGLLRQIQRIQVPVVKWDASQPDEMARQFSRFVKVRTR